VRYDECRPGEEVIYVVSTIGRKAASIKAGAEHSNQWSIIEQCKQHLALFVEYRIQLYKLQDLRRACWHFHYSQKSITVSESTMCSN